MTRVGILGCGNISQVYAHKLAALPFVELEAVADLLPERAKQTAEKYGVPKALSPDQLLADDAIDVVVNLTIPQAHFEMSRAALAAGKSVFSEKPLALSSAEARVLGEMADASGLRVGCAPDTFLGGGLQSCRKLIDDGAIGEPVSYAGFMMSPGPEGWHPGPRIFYERGAGPLFDMGPYYLTALVALLGPVTRVTGSARITHATRTIGSETLRGQSIAVEVPTHVSAVLDCERGPVATLVTSFDIQASRLRHIEIHGTEGTLAVPDPNAFGGPVRIRRAGGSEWEERPLTHANAEQSRGIGLADMVKAAQEGRPHRASLALASHVLELMEAIVRASDEGRHIEIESRCERPAALRAGLPDDVFDG